jgi:inhibitor of KinA
MADETVFPRFRPVAEHAILVEFGETIAAAVHDSVVRLDAALTEVPFPGLLEQVPAYTSLLVAFDATLCDHATAERAIRLRLAHPPARLREPDTHDVSVCYDADLAPDLAAVAERTGLDAEAVIAAHLSGYFKVYMYGFAPGYAYLAGVPEAIRLPRKPAAIRDIPAGSVLIAGPQCLVTTLPMPTGWWIIGRSPERLLPEAGSDRSMPFAIGDRVRFRRIDRATYDRMTGEC